MHQRRFCGARYTMWVQQTATFEGNPMIKEIWSSDSIPAAWATFRNCTWSMDPAEDVPPTRTEAGSSRSASIT